MKKASLHPYPGKVWLCQSREEFYDVHRRLTRTESDAIDNLGGIEVLLSHPKHGYVFLVYAESNACLVHELGHVCIDLFTQIINSQVEGGNGEPFCYLIESLFDKLAGFQNDI